MSSNNEFPIKIGVISDTHLHGGNDGTLPDWVISSFTGCQMILHAGDIVKIDILNELETVAECLAVKGNMDDWNLNLPTFRKIKIKKHSIVLAHNINEAMKHYSTDVTLVIYGHTHIPHFSKNENYWLLNPGSPTLPRGGKPPSVALVEVYPEKVVTTFKYPNSITDI